MNIQIESHTLLRAYERGASETEIIETIETGIPIKAKFMRNAKSKVYSFNQFRNNKFYEQKKLEVIYLMEKDQIITITVYVFFGKFE